MYDVSNFASFTSTDMQIVYRHFNKNELEHRLRQVQLKGHNGFYIYKDSVISFETVDPNDLTPPQKYVLNPTLTDILSVRSMFLGMSDIDVFALDGFIEFDVIRNNEPLSDGDAPIPFLPPIVEVEEVDGKEILLVNDGMHRVYAARSIGSAINVVVIRNLEYPYYAFPMREGWDAVVRFDELPDVFEKKAYRDPTNYKALFRQFNTMFPGVQKQRKQSNPEHLTA